MLKPPISYPLADPLTYRERTRWGIPHISNVQCTDGSEIRAVWDQQPQRPPKKGEWFLSGAIVEAYRAQNDFTHPYAIAKLVRVRKVVREIYEELSDVEESEEPAVRGYGDAGPDTASVP
jgi:hypothetical protein